MTEKKPVKKSEIYKVRRAELLALVAQGSASLSEKEQGIVARAEAARAAAYADRISARDAALGAVRKDLPSEEEMHSVLENTRRAAEIEAPYLAQIAEIDAQISELLSGMKKRQRKLDVEAIDRMILLAKAERRRIFSEMIIVSCDTREAHWYAVDACRDRIESALEVVAHEFSDITGFPGGATKWKKLEDFMPLEEFAD